MVSATNHYAPRGLRSSRFAPDGTRRVVYENTVPLDSIQGTDSSANMPEGIIPPITGITWHGGKIYIAHRSRYSVLDPDDDNPMTRFKTFVNGLPQWGAFVNGKPVFDGNGKMIFFVSSQGNAGVVDESWARQVLILNNRPGARGAGPPSAMRLPDP